MGSGRKDGVALWWKVMAKAPFGNIKSPDASSRVQALLASGQVNEALKLCEQCCLDNPGDNDLLLLMASIYARQGEIGRVEECCRKVLSGAPDNTIAWYNLGVAAQLGGCLAEAEQAYREVLVRQPDAPLALPRLVALLRNRGAHIEAQQLLQRAVHDSPGSEIAWFLLGQCQSDAAMQDAACHSYRKALLIRPDFPECSYALALLLSATGDYDEAQEILQEHLARNPGSPDLVAALAGLHEFRGDRASALKCLLPALQGNQVNLKLATVYAHCVQTDEERSAALQLLGDVMQRQEWPDIEQRDACYAGAALHDQLGHYTHAMEMYRHANRLEHAVVDIPAIEQEFMRLRAGFPIVRADAVVYHGNTSTLPVFIVGMPRSGTTLVEQVLASHSEVHGAGELNDIARMVSRLGRHTTDPYPECLRHLPSSTLDDYASSYIGRLAEIGQGACRVVDKMPHNFLALGLIDLLFPGTRIIHCVRDPRDTCLSVYFRHFSANHPYATDLYALGRYYREYARLMRYWKSVLQIPILDVVYEDMVEHPEEVIRSMLQFCDLEWQDRCLHYHRNSRVVTTPTYQDVRKPLYLSSLARWRHYREWLDELHAGLGTEWPAEGRVEPERT